MSSVSIVQRLWRYDRTVFERYERWAKRRGWEEAVRKRGTGHESIKDTLVHILNVQEGWLVGVAQRRWEIFDDPSRRASSIRSWSDLRAYRSRAWGEIDRLTSALSEGQLRRRVKAPWMPGSYTLEDAYFQVSIEQAHHLGEIIAISWQEDRSPPPMTWIENRSASYRRP